MIFMRVSIGKLPKFPHQPTSGGIGEDPDHGALPFTTTQNHLLQGVRTREWALQFGLCFWHTVIIHLAGNKRLVDHPRGVLRRWVRCFMSRICWQEMSCQKWEKHPSPLESLEELRAENCSLSSHSSAVMIELTSSFAVAIISYCSLEH